MHSGEEQVPRLAIAMRDDVETTPTLDPPPSPHAGKGGRGVAAVVVVVVNGVG